MQASDFHSDQGDPVNDQNPVSAAKPDSSYLGFLTRLCPLIVACALLNSCVSQRSVLWHGPNATVSSVAAAKAAGVVSAEPKAIVPIFVATSRKESGKLSNPYGEGRSSTVSFSRIDVGIPIFHNPGLVEKTRYKPDSAKHFVARQMVKFSGQRQFKDELDAALATKSSKDKEVVIFIHGYNNNFADSTFRAAQFAHDYRINSVMVHYAWPSAGALDLYVYDRDSANFARRGLAELLKVAATTDAKRVYIIGHSMGGFVTMEALRTLALSQERKTLKRLNHIVLAAPDIDLDVFENQLAEIGPPLPMSVVVSRRDNALGVSSVLTGGARLGDGTAIERMRRRGISVMDASEVDGGGHSAFASSPSLIALISEGSHLAENLVAMDHEQASAGGTSPITKAASMIIYAPATVADALTGGNGSP
ncbi:alpha/beta hydrolase [Rhizobium panacihumi]|uniref:alpha/beta hydrolase n=1 Tax=Rhizobium panacihumi TaxID=2008450 RepID=UPI003D7A5493